MGKLDIYNILFTFSENLKNIDKINDDDQKTSAELNIWNQNHFKSLKTSLNLIYIDPKKINLSKKIISIENRVNNRISINSDKDDGYKLSINNKKMISSQEKKNLNQLFHKNKQIILNDEVSSKKYLEIDCQKYPSQNNFFTDLYYSPIMADRKNIILGENIILKNRINNGKSLNDPKIFRFNKSYGNNKKNINQSNNSNKNNIIIVNSKFKFNCKEKYKLDEKDKYKNSTDRNQNLNELDIITSNFKIIFFSN